MLPLQSVSLLSLYRHFNKVYKIYCTINSKTTWKAPVKQVPNALVPVLSACRVFLLMRMRTRAGTRHMTWMERHGLRLCNFGSRMGSSNMDYHIQAYPWLDTTFIRCRFSHRGKCSIKSNKLHLFQCKWQYMQCNLAPWKLIKIDFFSPLT